MAVRQVGEVDYTWPVAGLCSRENRFLIAQSHHKPAKVFPESVEELMRPLIYEAISSFSRKSSKALAFTTNTLRSPTLSRAVNDL
jgi:hypothetical protein